MNKKFNRYFIMFGIVCIGISLFLANDAIQANEKYETLSSTLYVGGTGAGNYSKIQYAIDNASDGDTIFVYNGTYYENVVINKSISLIGEDKNTTIIDGNNSGDVVYVGADGVNISDFTIRNSNSSYAGIRVCSEYNTIFKCSVSDNYYGIWLYYWGNNNTIHDCNINSNNYTGIYVFYTNDNLIYNCNFSYNTWFGLSIHSSDNNTVYNCTSISNDFCGIGLSYTTNTRIYNCRAYLNDYYNIRLHNSYNNTIFSCSFFNSSKGIELWYSSNNTVYFCDILNNSYGNYIYGNSNNNFIFHNNFINNTIQAYDECNNTWDNGYPMGGNYWNDYTTPDNKHGYFQNMSGFDLIVDSSYNISGGSNTDRWPHATKDGWMKPLFVPNSLLVEFKQNVSNSTINTTIANYGTEITEYLPYVNVYILNITAGNQSEFDTLYMFQNDTNVSTISLDMYVYPRYKPEHLTTPNDQCYPKQWHLNNYGINPGVPTGLIDADIDAPQAWEHLTDCRKDWNNNDFVIAIIDTGVDLNHPDIVANLWTNPNEVAGDMANDGIDNDGDGLIDWLDPDWDGDLNPFNADDDGNGVGDDFHGAEFSVRGVWDNANRRWVMTFTGDGSPDDEDEHGTHCAGIICAHGNNGIGVTGVCWRAQLMVLKTGSVSVRGPRNLLNIGVRRASASLFARCVNYIIQQKNNGINVKVVSYSAGVSRDDVMRRYNVNANEAERIITRSGLITIYMNAIQRLNASQILFVCAVGNNGQHIDRIDAAGAYSDYPPKLTLPNIIAVAASDNRDRLASFSNWGTTSVDIVAPGENILSLAMHGRYVYRDNDGDNKVSVGDTRLSRHPNPQLWQRFRYSEITAIYPAGSTVRAGDGDSRRFLPGGGWWGYLLINFNGNERYWDLNGNNQYDAGEYIYRDNDNSGTVTAGDTRLTHIYINNELRYFHNSNVNAGDADVGKNLRAFTNERHRDYDGDNMYDVEEYIYRDVDNNFWVSAGDIRLTNVESLFRGNTNTQAGDSDIGDCLHAFAPNEKHTEDVNANGMYDLNEDIYIDNDNSGNVSVGDQRLRHWRYPAGSFVQPGDRDGRIGLNLVNFQDNEKYSLVRYMSGTSMATPMVTGSVANFWCQFPNLTHLQVKDWILRKVDPRASLKNTVVSGIYNDGRLRTISGFDFGDAPDPYLGLPGFYPTVLWHELSHGASHEDMGEEWLGWDVSPEYDANVVANPPYDVDASSNLLPSRTPPTPHPPYQQSPTPDLDAYDDGVSLPLIVFPGWIYPIEFHIQTENPFINDADHGRYDEFQVNKRDKKKIYINTYFDWNHDGDWDDGGEHLVKCPAKQCTWWGGPGMICCYGIFWPQWFGIGANLMNENAFRRTTFAVPWNALPGLTWSRTRLDYGENAGRPPWPRYDSHHPFISVGEILHDTYAHAQYGEVEDYWLYIINKVKEIGEPKYEETVLLDILQEDFTYGVPPTGWMDTHGAWFTSYTNYAGDVSPEAMLPWYYAEDGCMLITYPINTIGSNELALQFSTFVDDYNGTYYPYTLHIQTSTDGVSWQEVWNISPTEDYGPSLEEIVLTPENGVGSPTLYIAFTFTGYHCGLDYWYVDDVVISGDALMTYVTSSTPFEIIDYPLDSPYSVLNWYRLWYEGMWSDWIEYGDTFYLEGEGMHQIEYYGKAVENDRIIFYDGFENDMRWVPVDLDNMGYTWQWTNITPYWINETIEGYFMLLDDSICWEICNLDQLSSAPISCSIFNNTMLYFDGIFKTTGNEKLWVNVTNDYWETWTNVLTLEENSSGPWLINISSIADGKEVMIEFTYSDNCSVGYGALIKYVTLYGDVITYAPLRHQFHYIDETPPIAIIDLIAPYTQTSIPFVITYNASDDACGLKEVWLYFRYSYDNSTWSDWLPYAKSNNGEWIFHAPYAPAYYEFYSMAVDNLGNAEAYDGIEAMAYVPLQTFAFELKEGWNLITLPCINGYNASSLYADINGCSIILSWNASMQDFIIYVPGSPYDFEIEDGHGYFIGMKYDTYFALIYDPIEYVSIPLVVGWNILGWFKENETTASSLLENILGCNIVLKWNASMQDFDLYAPGVPDDFVIKRGDGFLVAVDEESEWHGEG